MLINEVKVMKKYKLDQKPYDKELERLNIPKDWVVKR